jgi:hypothetical protein
MKTLQAHCGVARDIRGEEFDGIPGIPSVAQAVSSDELTRFCIADGNLLVQRELAEAPIRSPAIDKGAPIGREGSDFVDGSEPSLPQDLSQFHLIELELRKFARLVIDGRSVERLLHRPLHVLGNLLLRQLRGVLRALAAGGHGEKRRMSEDSPAATPRNQEHSVLVATVVLLTLNCKSRASPHSH